MNKELKIFNNEEFGQVRVVTIDNEPYFVGKDIAVILGYSNPRKAISDHVDEEDKTDGVTIRDSIGRKQNPVCINESGLYSLILSSKLPTAKKFKRWVTNEVLPTIRKHGAYMSSEVIEKTLTSPDFIIRLATQLKEEQNARKIAEEKIQVLEPKAKFHDDVLYSENSISFGTFAAILQNNEKITLGRNEIMRWCRNHNYLCASDSLKNKPTQLMLDNKYMEYKQCVNEHNGVLRTTYTPMLTGKGQIFLTKKILDEMVE